MVAVRKELTVWEAPVMLVSLEQALLLVLRIFTKNLLVINQALLGFMVDALRQKKRI